MAEQWALPRGRLVNASRRPSSFPETHYAALPGFLNQTQQKRHKQHSQTIWIHEVWTERVKEKGWLNWRVTWRLSTEIQNQTKMNEQPRRWKRNVQPCEMSSITLYSNHFLHFLIQNHPCIDQNKLNSIIADKLTFQKSVQAVPSNTPNILLLDRSSNLGTLLSWWKLDNFKNCLNKSFRTSKILTLLYHRFLKV